MTHPRRSGLSNSKVTEWCQSLTDDASQYLDKKQGRARDRMPQTFWSRLWDKTKKDPLIPIGCTATLGCLGAGLYAFKSGEVRDARPGNQFKAGFELLWLVKRQRSGCAPDRSRQTHSSFPAGKTIWRPRCTRIHIVLIPTQKHLSQRMMRARVLAQGFTIVVLMAGKGRKQRTKTPYGP